MAGFVSSCILQEDTPLAVLSDDNLDIIVYKPRCLRMPSGQALLGPFSHCHSLYGYFHGPGNCAPYPGQTHES